MRAIQYIENSADINALKEVHIDKPTATPGMAVVKVKAAAANPIDSKVMQGQLLEAGWAMPLPFTMGYDFAGIVEEVGDGVSQFSEGDEVFGVNWGEGKHDSEGQPVGGAFAEYILVPVSKLSKKPAHVSFEHAAAVSLVGTTAYQLLFTCAKLKPDDRILILGGSTAVGSIAVQLAKTCGAWVATTCSNRTRDYTRQFGADELVDYDQTRWEEDEELHGLDAVIDTVGEPQAFQKVCEEPGKIVKLGGTFVSIASFDAGFDPKAYTPEFSYAAFYCLSNDTSVQDELVDMLDDHSLQLHIDKEFTFGERGVRELISYQNSGKSCGKNVLLFPSKCHK
jgi:NADPH:quinone reductase-like Zn-dependent oxidoreductase